VPILKLLRSAGANAENNDDLDVEDLRVDRISVDEGPTMRRYRPRARGRATRIEKRSCHISIALTPIPDAD
jgi:large subunit ribosomal protein L22